MRVDRRAGKWVLRQVLHRYVPWTFVEPAEEAFGPPLGEWLRGPLRDWAEDLLVRAPAAGRGLLRARPDPRPLGQHLAGERNWEYHLWAVLMFNAFLDRWKPPSE